MILLIRAVVVKNFSVTGFADLEIFFPGAAAKGSRLVDSYDPGLGGLHATGRHGHGRWAVP